MKFRSHSVIGIHELNGKIVFVQEALGDAPLEAPLENTIFPTIIIADVFSPDFSIHAQRHVSYKETTVLHGHYAESYIENGRLFLNTLKTMRSSWADYQKAFAKVFEITGTEIRELSPSPEPEKLVYPDSKTYRFGNFALRMASPFKLECRAAASGALVWELRLRSYLYTELEVHDGILYFGTAGSGGHFYGVSLADGRMIFDWNTGGTTDFTWVNRQVLITDRKGDLVLLNPANGVEMKRFHFKKLRAATGLPVLVHENSIYTVLCDGENLHAACVDIPREA